MYTPTNDAYAYVQETEHKPEQLSDVEPVADQKELLVFHEIAAAIVAHTSGRFEMANMSVLAAASAAAQDGFVIQSPSGEIKPLGVLLCMSAPSGTRKSTTLRTAMLAIHEHETATKTHEATEWKSYQSRLEIHRLRKAKILKKITHKSGANDEALISELEEHQRTEPVIPKSYQRLASNSTIEGLLKRYDESRYSPFLEADEGRHAMTLIMNERSSQLCKLYDGDPISTSRASVKSLSIQAPRISGIFMLQPGILTDYIGKHGRKSVESGLWARIMVIQLEHANNQLPLVRIPYDTKTIELYHERIRELLSYTDRVLSGEEKQGVLSLDLAAQSSWNSFSMGLTEYRRTNPDMSDSAHAYLSRAPENLLRVAGLMHLIETGDSSVPIQFGTMETAKSHINRYIDEFMRLFERGGLDQDHIDDQQLYARLCARYQAGIWITKTQVHAVAPRCLRGKGQRLRASLERLVLSGNLGQGDVLKPSGRKIDQQYFINTAPWGRTYF